MRTYRQLKTLLLLLWLGSAFAGAAAQDSLPTLAGVTPRGSVVARLRSRANPMATYAVYLPARYDVDRRWPIVFLLDPRGRALVPMELFREPAERLGYVLVSSYDSQSDGPRAPNDMALDAMLEDAQRYLSIDTKRLYFAGFSGTARFAWDVSEQFPNALAGIIGFGAGTAGDRRWLAQHVRGAPFDYFGAVGNTDPNYLEMRQLARDLEEASIPFRIEEFDGPHAWPPAATCRRALDWMELRAMRRGLRPATPEWIDSTARSRLADASAMSGVSALRALRGWIQDFGMDHDTTEAATRAARLASDATVRRQIRREDELESKDQAWMRGYFAFLSALRREDPPPGAGAGKRQAAISEIVKLARSAGDSLGAVAARRAINRVLVYATFYEFRDYVRERQWERARILLEVAEAAAPDDGSVCFGLARVEAQLLKPRDAFEHLACAERAGVLTHALLQHELLAPLRADPRFRELDARMKT